MNYYNEFDPFAAAWLRALIEKGLIPAGDVDERSITEVKADDLKGYTQCHFFSGIGGWSYALHLAEWDSNRPVWTGSCPCQPFSSAGNRKGKEDDRHLWPVWFNLIRECRPPVVFGEQVSSAIAHGWLDDVYKDMEAEGYAIGSAVLPACSVGAPHKRDRLWFVADARSERLHNERPSKDFRPESGMQSAAREQWVRPDAGEYGEHILDVADTINQGSQGHGQSGEQSIQEMRQGKERYPWESGVWLDCPDGKQRLVEPGIPLLAYGVPNRVGKLRGYGNAIVAQVAAEFVMAYMETTTYGST